MRVRARDSTTPSNLAIDPVIGSLSSLADTQYSMESNLFKTLDDLINIWCQRRALLPLAYLLPAYPGVSAHNDQQFQLLEALKNLKRLCLDLTPQELRLVTQVHDFLDGRLRTSVI